MNHHMRKVTSISHENLNHILLNWDNFVMPLLGSPFLFSFEVIHGLLWFLFYAWGSSFH